jgi:sec-independent protein translocase protein TatC
MTTQPISAPEPTMTFWDHLEELRWALIKCIVVLVVATGLGLVFTNSVSEVLQRPLQAISPAVELIFSAPLDAFVSRVKLGVLAGIVLSIPFILYFAWDFIAPGLHEHERRVAWIAIIAGSMMFLLGVLFGYRLLFFGLPAVVNMGLHDARHLWSLRSYLEFCFRFLLAFGVIFELPVVLVALGRLGLVRAATLSRIRAYAVIAIFLLAAIITPPDPLTQLMLGLPLLLLYEASIVLVRLTQKT